MFEGRKGGNMFLEDAGWKIYASSCVHFELKDSQEGDRYHYSDLRKSAIWRDVGENSMAATMTICPYGRILQLPLAKVDDQQINLLQLSLEQISAMIQTKPYTFPRRDRARQIP